MEYYNNRLLSNNYAPGIATYGVDGKDGSKGNDGTSFYFTNYDLEYGADNNEIEEVLIKIKQNKILSSFVDKDHFRKYNIGDIIVDGRGYIYKIVLGGESNDFALQYISKFYIDDSSNFFQKIDNRVLITENGLDIYDTYDSSIIEKVDNGNTFPLRLISSIQNSVNGGEFLSLNAKTYNNENKFLNITYNKELESFVFESDSNIVFDVSSLMVRENYETDQSFSEYYRVEPYNDPLGLLHRVYSNVTYSTYNDNKKVMRIGDFDVNYSNIDIIPDYVKLKKSLTSSTSEKIIIIDKSNVILETDENGTYTGKQYLVIKCTEDISKYNFVSLIKGIEINIKKDKEL